MQVEGMEVRMRGHLVRIAYLDGEGYQFLCDPEKVPQVIRSFGKRVDLFTFIPKISDSTPRFNYPMEWDNMAAIPVTTYDHWLTKQIDFKVRNKIKKASKSGVVVREVPLNDYLLRGIHTIYNETPFRQGRRFLHYGKNIETLRRIKGTFAERSIFAGAFFEDNLIGFIKLVFDRGNNQAGLMHILSMIQHRDKAPTNALLAHAVRLCAERRTPYLFYANMSYGKKQDSALADFKRHNAFQKIDLPRYYMPLTAIGRLALRFELQRSFTERVPERIAERYRKLRSLWYEKRFPGVKGV
jgi:hypothetical protein